MRQLLLPTALALAIGGIPARASASLLGEENATLAAILVEAKKSLDSINQQLATGRQTYDQVKRSAQLADDGLSAFNAARQLNFRAQAFQDLVEATFPDAAAVERDAGRAGFWRGTGEFGRLMRYCIDQRVATPTAKSFNRCIELEDAVSAAQVRANLEKTFGGPARTPSQKAADDAAAAAIAKSHAAAQSAALSKMTSKTLAQQCAQASNPAECQAAANAATINQLEELARVNEQLAEANKLQALRIEQENLRRKSESDALEIQGRMALDAFGQATQPAPRIDFDALEAPR